MKHEKPLYSKVTVAGHPVHPMLVGFPVALYTGTVVGFLIHAWTHDPFWFRLAYAANVAGVVMAVVAAIPGFIDWALGIPARTAAKVDGAIHMALNLAALFFFATNLAVSAVGRLDSAAHATRGMTLGPALILTTLGLACTIGAGWFGWRMVQVHHVGIQMSPPVPTSAPRQDVTRIAS